MTLKPGIHLGRYEIRSKIGEGGMGEVYLVEDTQLHRNVALKILPAEVASNQDRMRRFNQEAQAAAALNHPNIAHIYEIGESDGLNFIAMEFIDGQTLRQRMDTAQMKLTEVLDLSIQIANALTVAHASGILHRDIKPENVMLRQDSIVKVLDFGLAKLTEPTKGDIDSRVVTRALVETEPGRVMGTVAYMSPEQVRGRDLDVRTDIWSLGVVLYEMLAGQPPFAGETSSHVSVSILEKEPVPLGQYMPDAPAELHRIVRKALAKERDDRYQTARDLMIDIKSLRRDLDLQGEIERSAAPHQGATDAISSGGHVQAEAFPGDSIAPTQGERSGPVTKATFTPPTSSAEYIVNEIKRHKTGALVVAAVAVLAAIALGYALYRFASNPKPSVAHFQNIKLTRVTTEGSVSGVTMSPDGKYIAYVLVEGGKRSLWTKHLATGSRVQIAGPIETGAMTPSTFSRDGNYVYYVLTDSQHPQGALFQVPVLGGAPKKILTDIKTPISLSPDGTQFVFERYHTGAVVEDELILANADGSNERRLISRQAPEWLAPFSAWSPDGKAIAIGHGSIEGGDHMEVAVVSVADGTLKETTSQRWFWVGRVAWFADASGLAFIAQEQALGAWQIWQVSYSGGQARRITNDLNSYDYAGLSLTADNSALVALQAQRSSNIWIGPAGDASRARMVTSGKDVQEGGAGLGWTPDGKVVYETNIKGNGSIWLMNADGSNAAPLTDGAADDEWPVVSPDGRYLISVSQRSKSSEVWRMDIDGGNPKRLTDGKAAWPGSISPDGKWIIYGTYSTKIWKVSIDGGTSVKLLAQGLAYFSQVSPDSKLLAYSSRDEQTKRRTIVIIPFEGGPAVRTFDLPGSGSFVFHWSPDGRSLAFVETVGLVSNLWRQPLDGGKPVQTTDFKSNVIYNFAYSRDGKQLALSRGTPSSDAVIVTDVK